MVRLEVAAVDPGVEARRQAAWAIVSRKPCQHGRGQRAELMPAGAAPRCDQEMLEAVIRVIHFRLPQVQRRLRNLEGEVSLPKVQHGLPEEPSKEIPKKRG